MRIAIFLGEFPALSETFILRRITGLMDRGHDVEIFSHRPRKEKETPPAYDQYQLYNRCHYLSKGPERGMRKFFLVCIGRICLGLFGLRMLRCYSIRYLCRYLTSRSTAAKLDATYDVVYAAFGTHALEAMKYQKDGLLRGPLVVSFHGYDLSRFLRESESCKYPELFKHIRFALPVCRYFAQRLETLGMDKEKTAVLYSGVEVSRIDYRGGRPFNKVVRLISVGRLVEKKGMSDIIECVSQLIAKGVQAHLSLVGSGPLQPDLEAQAASLPEGSVTFHGWLSPTKLYALIADSDVFVGAYIQAVNGDEDTIPNVMKEAMSVGVPVIATNHSGTPELIDHDESGILVDPGSPEQIAEAVVDLINNPDKTNQLVTRARKIVEEKFESERINDCLERILAEAAGMPS